jgi:hypothetical protein
MPSRTPAVVPERPALQPTRAAVHLDDRTDLALIASSSVVLFDPGNRWCKIWHVQDIGNHSPDFLRCYPAWIGFGACPCRYDAGDHDLPERNVGVGIFG